MIGIAMCVGLHRSAWKGLKCFWWELVNSGVWGWYIGTWGIGNSSSDVSTPVLGFDQLIYLLVRGRSVKVWSRIPHLVELSDCSLNILLQNDLGYLKGEVLYFWSLQQLEREVWASHDCLVYWQMVYPMCGVFLWKHVVPFSRLFFLEGKARRLSHSRHTEFHAWCSSLQFGHFTVVDFPSLSFLIHILATWVSFRNSPRIWQKNENLNETRQVST